MEAWQFLSQGTAILLSPLNSNKGLFLHFLISLGRRLSTHLPESCEEIILYLATAIDQAKGAIISLAIP